MWLISFFYYDTIDMGKFNTQRKGKPVYGTVYQDEIRGTYE